MCYVIGEIGADLHQKYTKKYNDRLDDIDRKITNVFMICSSLENIKNEAVLISLKLSSKWLNIPYENKEGYISLSFQ